MRNIKNEMDKALCMLGVRALREEQKLPLQAALAGKNIIVRLPTGKGKSLIGQVPAIVDNKGYTLVISPMLALQSDQMAKMLGKGVTAYLLNSAQSTQERNAVLAAMKEGPGNTLLYLGPEQLVKEDIQCVLSQGGCRRVIVDEAHLILGATEHFRPEFHEIANVIQKLPVKPQVIALTATVTEKGIRALKRELELPDAEVFKGSIRRTNLKLSIHRVSGDSHQDLVGQAVLRQLEKIGEGKTIIYCPTPKRAEEIYRLIKSRGYPAACLHGKTKHSVRKEEQHRFAQGKCRIMVSTSAFGLGVDIPDVRLVIHAGLPLTVDAYFQEIGRAGRDGRTAKCCLIYHDGDFGRNKAILKRDRPSKYVSKQDKLLHEIVSGEACVWKLGEKYFGDKVGKRCHNCPSCRRKHCC